MVGRDKTEHDVPGVEDQRHANDVNDLIDAVVVKLSVAVNHEGQVDALVLGAFGVAEILELLLNGQSVRLLLLLLLWHVDFDIITDIITKK